MSNNRPGQWGLCSHRRYIGILVGNHCGPSFVLSLTRRPGIRALWLCNCVRPDLVFGLHKRFPSRKFWIKTALIRCYSRQFAAKIIL